MDMERFGINIYLYIHMDTRARYNSGWNRLIFACSFRIRMVPMMIPWSFGLSVVQFGYDYGDVVLRFGFRCTYTNSRSLAHKYTHQVNKRARFILSLHLFFRLCVEVPLSSSSCRFFFCSAFIFSQWTRFLEHNSKYTTNSDHLTGSRFCKIFTFW